MSQENTWIEMRFYGLLAFRQRSDHMEIGVLNSAPGHRFLVTIEERPIQGGNPQLPDVPYLVTTSPGVDLRLSQREGVESQLGGSSLLQFDGEGGLHPGRQICRRFGLTPSVKIYDGHFTAIDEVTYRLIRIENNHETDLGPKNFAFGVRATINRAEGRQARLNCAEGTITLDQDRNYRLLFNNSPSRASTVTAHSHFQLYYEAFNQITDPRFDVRELGAHVGHSLLQVAAPGQAFFFTFERPCLGMHLIESEPQ